MRLEEEAEKLEDARRREANRSAIRRSFELQAAEEMRLEEEAEKLEDARRREANRSAIRRSFELQAAEEMRLEEEAEEEAAKREAARAEAAAQEEEGAAMTRREDARDRQERRKTAQQGLEKALAGNGLAALFGGGVDPSDLNAALSEARASGVAETHRMLLEQAEARLTALKAEGLSRCEERLRAAMEPGFFSGAIDAPKLERALDEAREAGVAPARLRQGIQALPMLSQRVAAERRLGLAAAPAPPPAPPAAAAKTPSRRPSGGKGGSSAASGRKSGPGLRRGSEKIPLPRGLPPDAYGSGGGAAGRFGGGGVGVLGGASVGERVPEGGHGVGVGAGVGGERWLIERIDEAADVAVQPAPGAPLNLSGLVLSESDMAWAVTASSSSSPPPRPPRAMRWDDDGWTGAPRGGGGGDEPTPENGVVDGSAGRARRASRMSVERAEASKAEHDARQGMLAEVGALARGHVRARLDEEAAREEEEARARVGLGESSDFGVGPVVAHVDAHAAASQAASRRGWFYLVSVAEGQRGPVTLEELLALYDQERVALRTLVWAPGLASWCPLGDLVKLEVQHAAAEAVQRVFRGRAVRMSVYAGPGLGLAAQGLRGSDMAIPTDSASSGGGSGGGGDGDVHRPMTAPKHTPSAMGRRPTLDRLLQDEPRRAWEAPAQPPPPPQPSPPPAPPPPPRAPAAIDARSPSPRSTFGSGVRATPTWAALKQRQPDMIPRLVSEGWQIMHQPSPEKTRVLQPAGKGGGGFTAVVMAAAEVERVRRAEASAARRHELQAAEYDQEMAAERALRRQSAALAMRSSDARAAEEAARAASDDAVRHRREQEALRAALRRSLAREAEEEEFHQRLRAQSSKLVFFF